MSVVTVGWSRSFTVGRFRGSGVGEYFLHVAAAAATVASWESFRTVARGLGVGRGDAWGLVSLGNTGRLVVMTLLVANSSKPAIVSIIVWIRSSRDRSLLFVEVVLSMGTFAPSLSGEPSPNALRSSAMASSGLKKMKKFSRPDLIACCRRVLFFSIYHWRYNAALTGNVASVDRNKSPFKCKLSDTIKILSHYIFSQW